MSGSYDSYCQRIRCTVADAAGGTHELTCRVTLSIVERGKTIATVRPEPGQFRISAIAVLLADIRTVYIEALNNGQQLARLGDHAVLDLADPVPAGDVSWITDQAWLLGIELEVQQPSA